MRSNNPDVKMMTQTGAYSGLNKGAVEKVSRGGRYGGGGSGSVWIRCETASSNGVHVSSGGTTSASPYLTKSLVDDVIYP